MPPASVKFPVLEATLSTPVLETVQVPLAVIVQVPVADMPEPGEITILVTVPAPDDEN